MSEPAARGARFRRVVCDIRFIVALTALVVAVSSILKYAASPVAYNGAGHASYNNYVVFRNAFSNLVAHRDLYAWHLDQQWDLYKYSPSFAVLMAPFAALPTLPGLVLWNLLNALSLVLAIQLLPLERRAARVAVYLVLIELVTSVQNAQSNGLVAALFLLTFAMLERDKPALAALFTVLNVAIKLFGAAGLVLFLLYPSKRRAAGWLLLWLVVIAALPLLVVGPAELSGIYRSWLVLLREDTVRANTLSFYGWLGTWFGLAPPRAPVLAASAVVLCLPLLRIRRYGERSFRLLMLASVLIWVVVFNHKAESPTFIIAWCGVVLWYFATPPSPFTRTVLALSFVLVTLSPTDVFPKWIRTRVFAPYSAKAVPCIAVWGLVGAQLLFGRPRDEGTG